MVSIMETNVKVNQSVVIYEDVKEDFCGSSANITRLMSRFAEVENLSNSFMSLH